MTNTEKKARALIATLSLKLLVIQFELTEEQNSEASFMVRGWVMDELERRNSKAFNAWLDSDIPSPRDFFL